MFVYDYRGTGKLCRDGASVKNSVHALIGGEPIGLVGTKLGEEF